MTVPARAPRWPWIVSATLSVAVIASLECRRVRPVPQRHTGDDDRRPGASLPARPARWRARPPRRLRLPPAPPGLVRVAGHVRDIATGEPVEGVEVVFVGDRDFSTSSDADGHYTLAVRPGRYRPVARGKRVVTMEVVGRDQRAAHSSTAAPAPPSPAPGAILDVHAPLAGVDLEVTPAAVIRGVVIDPTGRPAAGALVRTIIDGNGEGRPAGGTDQAVTDDHGRFSLLIPARSVQLEASHPDFGITALRPMIEPDPGGEYELELELVPGCVIEGRVVRPGRPMTGGGIERAAGSGAMAYSGVARFSDDGRFRWITEETTDILLRASVWSAPASRPRRFDCHAGARYHDVVFEIPHDTPVLAGRVVAADSQPVPFALVDVTARDIDAATVERTGADGAWATYGLPPGAYQVVARVPGKGVATVEAEIPDRDLTLTLSGTGTVEGHTRGLVDGVVTLEVDCPHEGRSYWGTSERFLVPVRGGAFQARGLPVCRASVVLVSGGWRSPPLEAAISASASARVEFDLSQVTGRDVFGVVVTPDGQPAQQATVTVRGQAVAATMTDEHGRFFVRAPQGATLDVVGTGRAVEVQVPTGSAAAWNVEVPLGP